MPYYLDVWRIDTKNILSIIDLRGMLTLLLRTEGARAPLKYYLRNFPIRQHSRALQFSGAPSPTLPYPTLPYNSMGPPPL
jgi:hypothetical protein